MFVVNDKGENRRWSNGTIGIVEEIKQNNGIVDSVRVNINQNGKTMKYDVTRIQNPINGICNGSLETIGNVENFPFIPAFSTTIDKIQGGTLDKAAIVLGNMARPNQIYVGLSRVGSLKNLLILGRKLSSYQVKKSKNIDNFIASIEPKICGVYYKPELKVNNALQLSVNGNKNNINIVIEQSFLSAI